MRSALLNTYYCRVLRAVFSTTTSTTRCSDVQLLYCLLQAVKGLEKLQSNIVSCLHLKELYTRAPNVVADSQWDV
jgi:hypothetical protein